MFLSYYSFITSERIILDNARYLNVNDDILLLSIESRRLATIIITITN